MGQSRSPWVLAATSVDNLAFDLGDRLDVGCPPVDAIAGLKRCHGQAMEEHPEGRPCQPNAKHSRVGLLPPPRSPSLPAIGLSGSFWMDAPPRSVIRDKRPGRVFASDHVHISLLGPIEVTGCAQAIKQPKPLESISYLALHQNGVSKASWAEALWPDSVHGRDSMNTELWRLRRSLGVSRSGAQHFPPAHGQELRLAPSVSTDYANFLQLADSTDPAKWRSALELVRGRPFDGLGEPAWLVLEGFLVNADIRIVDTAIALAEHAIEDGELREALWAARQALVAVPYDERLWRIVLRATRQLGNVVAVSMVMGEIVTAMTSGGDPQGSVSAETLRLYRALMSVGSRDTGTPG